MYAELQRMVEQSQAELVEVIATRQREAERHAQELARGLENELSQLRRRSNELEAHAQTQDKVVFLQVQRRAAMMEVQKLKFLRIKYVFFFMFRWHTGGVLPRADRK